MNHPAWLRPLLHASTALSLLALLDSWQALRALLAGLGIAAIVVEVLRLRYPAVGVLLARLVPVFRPRERARPSGAVWLFLGLALAAWMPPPAPAAAVLAGSLADPAAAVVGGRWGGGLPKSWPGTLAVWLTTALSLACWGIAPGVAGLAGLVAAVLERWPGPFDDNLLVAPAVGVVVWALG